MAWSINAKGTKEECVAALEAAAHPDTPADERQFKAVLAKLKHELEQYGDGSAEMNIAASGHVPGPGFSDRSLSIWISGRAAQPAEAKPAPEPTHEPTPEPIPPLTTRRR